jgi:hypothetical protein
MICIDIWMRYLIWLTWFMFHNSRVVWRWMLCLSEDPCLGWRFGGCTLWLPIAWRGGSVHGLVGLPFEAGPDAGSEAEGWFPPWVNWTWMFQTYRFTNSITIWWFNMVTWKITMFERFWEVKDRSINKFPVNDWISMEGGAYPWPKLPGIESAAIGGLRQRWAASQRSHFVGGRLSHVDPWADLVGWGAVCPLKNMALLLPYL